MTADGTPYPVPDQAQPWHGPAVDGNLYQAGADELSLGVTPQTGDETTLFHGTGGGFTPNSVVTDTVYQPDGNEYAGAYTHSRQSSVGGTISWAWAWGSGDPLGTYTFVAQDVSGATDQTTFTIGTQQVGPPSPDAGSSLMFDTASAPSAQDMTAWSASPYRTIGVYIPVDPSVDDRHDKTQANLTAGWVSAVRGDGWTVLPIYLGIQAPQQCLSADFWPMSSDPGEARDQGLSAADYAAKSAASLSIPATVPVIYDMEPYYSGCAAAVTAFLDGWTMGLHQAGRLSAVYGSQSSVMADLYSTYFDPSYHLPDDVWVETDNGNPSTAHLTDPPDGTWSGHRLNQFNLDVERTYGGVSLDVDESAVNDAVQSSTPASPDRTPPAVRMKAVPRYVISRSLGVSWTGSDTQTAVTSFDVRERFAHYGTSNSGQYSRWSRPPDLQSDDQTSVMLTLASGESACVAVRGRDLAGNLSPWSGAACTTRAIDDRRLAASKGWARRKSPGFYEGTYTSSTIKSATLTLAHVAGQAIGILVKVGHRFGTLHASLGGHALGQVRCAVRSGSKERVIWLHVRNHRGGKLTLTNLTDRRVIVDGIVIQPST